jgi:hypothetical protein
VYVVSTVVPSCGAVYRLFASFACGWFSAKNRTRHKDEDADGRRRTVDVDAHDDERGNRTQASDDDGIYS